MEELDSDDEIVIITDDSPEPGGQEQAPHLQDHGGDCWGGRFRRTVHAPDRYTAHIEVDLQDTGSCLIEKTELCSENAGAKSNNTVTRLTEC